MPTLLSLGHQMDSVLDVYTLPILSIKIWWSQGAPNQILFTHLGSRLCTPGYSQILHGPIIGHCIFLVAADSGSGSWLYGAQWRTRKLKRNGVLQGQRIRKTGSQGSQYILVTIYSTYWVSE